MKIIISIVSCLLLSGCMNMPTATAQIAGSENSGIAYENYSCSRLSIEADTLSRRKSQLTLAQEQRIKTSQMQAFWWGFGQGDGIEASELAQVRGEINAIKNVSSHKHCGIRFPEQQAPAAPAKQTKSQFRE